jgi:hypothetical protein
MIMELLMSNSYSSLVNSQQWHSESMLPEELKNVRDGIVHYIAQLIHQRRPYSSDIWVNELHRVSSAIETRLFLRAQSLEEYRNLTTILLRVQVHRLHCE